jgi:hypothetical protein
MADRRAIAAVDWLASISTSRKANPDGFYNRHPFDLGITDGVCYLALIRPQADRAGQRRGTLGQLDIRLDPIRKPQPSRRDQRRECAGADVGNSGHVLR